MKPFSTSTHIVTLLGVIMLFYTTMAAAQPVTFAFRAPEAQSVSISGSFDQWKGEHPLKRDHTGLWSITLDLPKGRLEFLYLIDDNWQINPLLPSLEDGFGGRNNVLIVQ